MEEGRREVADTLEQITRDELIWVGEEKGGKSRRAAVFYFDKVEFERISAFHTCEENYSMGCLRAN